MLRNPNPPDQQAPLVVCAVCHRGVPEHHIVRLSGRLQCLACAAAWFDDEDDDDGKETEH